MSELFRDGILPVVLSRQDQERRRLAERQELANVEGSSVDCVKFGSKVGLSGPNKATRKPRAQGHDGET